MVARAVAHVPGATRKFFKDRHTKSIDHAPPRVDEALVRTEVLLPGGLVGVRPLAADGLPGLLPARGIAVSIRMASNSKKKPPTSIIPGDESRRWREGASTRRDAASAPHLPSHFLELLLRGHFLPQQLGHHLGVSTFFLQY